jgi:hypothetical protein
VANISEIRAVVETPVRLAVSYWPNAHLGDCSPREDIRSAFLLIRSAMKRGDSIQAAAGQVEFDAYRHADM